MKNLFINLPIKLSLFHLKIKFHRNKSKRKGRYSTLTCHKNFIPSKKSTRQNLANSLSPKETNFEDRLTLLSNFQPNYPFPTFPFLELTSLSLSVYMRVNKRLIRSVPLILDQRSPHSLRSESDRERTKRMHRLEDRSQFTRTITQFRGRRASPRILIEALKRNIEPRPSTRFINSRYERLDPRRLRKPRAIVAGPLERLDSLSAMRYPMQSRRDIGRYNRRDEIQAGLIAHAILSYSCTCSWQFRVTFILYVSVIFDFFISRYRFYRGSINLLAMIIVEVDVQEIWDTFNFIIYRLV